MPLNPTHPDLSPFSRPIQPMSDFVHQALWDRGLFDAYKARPAYQPNDYPCWIKRAKRLARNV